MSLLLYLTFLPLRCFFRLVVLASRSLSVVIRAPRPRRDGTHNAEQSLLKSNVAAQTASHLHHVYTQVYTRSTPQEQLLPDPLSTCDRRSEPGREPIRCDRNSNLTLSSNLTILSNYGCDENIDFEMTAILCEYKTMHYIVFQGYQEVENLPPTCTSTPCSHQRFKYLLIISRTQV